MVSSTFDDSVIRQVLRNMPQFETPKQACKFLRNKIGFNKIKSPLLYSFLFALMLWFFWDNAKLEKQAGIFTFHISQKLFLLKNRVSPTCGCFHFLIRFITSY